MKCKQFLPFIGTQYVAMGVYQVYLWFFVAILFVRATSKIRSENQESDMQEPTETETPEPTPAEQFTEEQPQLRTSFRARKTRECWEPMWTSKKQNVEGRCGRMLVWRSHTHEREARGSGVMLDCDLYQRNA